MCRDGRRSGDGRQRHARAEYNIWVDPEAARMVFHSALPLEMVGWQTSRYPAILTPEEIAGVYNMGTPLAKFAMDCNRRAREATEEQSGEVGLGLPDPVAMAVALDPTICTRRSDHYVEIETESDLTRGMTVVDVLGVAEDERNSPLWRQAIHAGRKTICWEIDAPRWKGLLVELLG